MIAPIAGTLLAFFAGLSIGFIYYAGLWLTVQRLRTVDRPAMLMAVSFILRMGAALAVFYLIVSQGPHWFVACLTGFTLVRVILVRKIGQPLVHGGAG